MPALADSGADFPEDLPVIAPDQNFTFACGPEQPCFNRCCAQLALPLTPYDCLRLARNLALTCAETLRIFATPANDPQTGFPAFMLRMIESPDAPCPFVTPAGCSVYEDRPGACRAYPLGRGARVSADGIAERFFMIREPHCAGFGCGAPQTPGEWLHNQGLERYNYFNDRYMRLLSMVRIGERPLAARLRPLALLSLWQPDSFRDFIRQMRLADKVIWNSSMEDLDRNDEKGAEAALDFGLSWLELVIFGKAPDLRKSPALP